MKGSLFYYYVQLLYYKCHKRNFNRGGSYMDCPDQRENKKTITNPIKKKDNYKSYQEKR